MRPLCFAWFLLLASSAIAAQPPSAAELAARIDGRLTDVWRQNGLKPNPLTDDAAFLRRVMLDLVGRIPTAAEARDFLADQRSDKRELLVERLIASAAHARHFAVFLRRSWLPQTDVDPHDYLAEEADRWIAEQLQRGTPYNRLVYRLVAAAAEDLADSPADFVSENRRAPDTFLRANDYRAENLAANVARAYLGVNLECAQCHDHPFARWTRDQFWETAAFFARPKRGKDGDLHDVRLELAIPDSDLVVTPRLLTGESIVWPRRIIADTGRRLLAEWVIRNDNPYFAKNAVNHVWAHFFGAGLLDPLDDLSAGEAVDERLLDDLAKAFIASDYDLAYLTRAIACSKAYQRSSITPVAGAASKPLELFARAPIRGLTGEQLFDSLRVAAGLPVLSDDLATTAALRQRRRFTKRFRIERAGSAERAILQSLTLMNGDLVNRLTHHDNSPTVIALARAPFLNDRQRVEMLYLAALGRRPHEEEFAQRLEYLAPGVDGNDGNDGASRAERMSDLLWALLNSVEFNTNH
ncbi:MAG: DUF1549 domain-containing protein [Pirellulaceae bacterium]